MHARYRPLGSAFVIFEAPRPYNLGTPRVIPFGPITDISRQGLSVEYTPHKDLQRNFQELSILIPGQGLAVYRIPFQDISDIAVSDAATGPLVMRRGVQFLAMDAFHSNQVEDMIAAYTRNAVPERRSGYDRRGLTVPAPDSQGEIQPHGRTDREQRSGRDRRRA